MTFLHSVVSFPVGYLIATVALVAALAAMWIATLLSRRLYVTVRKSEETEMVTIYLSRIADSLERLAASREPLMHLEEPRERHDLREESSVVVSSERRPVANSMFGL